MNLEEVKELLRKTVNEGESVDLDKLIGVTKKILSMWRHTWRRGIYKDRY